MSDQAQDKVLTDDEAARLHVLTGPCAISVASARLGFCRRSCTMRDGTIITVIAPDAFHREVYVNDRLLGAIEL